MAKAGYIFMCMGEESDTYRKAIGWMREYGCTRIVQESPEDEALRPEWKRILGELDRNDEIIVSSFSNALRGSLELCYFLELCRVNVIRVISIEDKIDSKDELFPGTKTSDILHAFESLPFEIGIVRKAAQQLVENRQDTTEIKLTKKAKRERDSTIINMYNNGFSIDEIWKNSGYKARSSVFNVLRRYQIPLRREVGTPADQSRHKRQIPKTVNQEQEIKGEKNGQL